MLIIPDFHILRMSMAANPFHVFVFAMLLLMNTYYFWKWIRPTGYLLDKILFFLVIVFAVVQIHLMSFLLIAILYVFLYSKEQFDVTYCTRRTIVSVGFLGVYTLIGIAYTQVLSAIDPSLHLGPIETIRKLYNYPNIYQKFLAPILDTRIPITFSFGCLATIGLLLLNDSYLNRKSVSFPLLIIIVCVSIIGVARTYYAHIRYSYFLFPVLIYALTSFLYVAKCKTKDCFKPDVICFVLVIMIGGFEINTAYNSVVMAQPGTPEKYTPHRVYLDFRTCAGVLNRDFTSGDYILSIGSAHQAAVYLNPPIHAALRPRLREYTDSPQHYITGSYFFDDISDLNTLLRNADLKSSSNVWILLGSNNKQEGSWPNAFSKAIQSHIVCRAEDNINSLVRISSADLFSLLSSHSGEYR